MPTPTMTRFFVPIAAAAVLLVGAAQPNEPKPLVMVETDVFPERRAGRAFLPMRAAATALDQPVEWDAKTQTVRLGPASRRVTLQVGSRQGTVGVEPVDLEAAPYLRYGRVMIPVRFAAEALSVPVGYDKRTASVFIGPATDGILRVLPLEIGTPGTVIRWPRRNAVVTSPLRVQGQANEFEGVTVLELRAGGKTVAQDIGMGAMGFYRPFLTELKFTPPASGTRAAELWVYAESPRDGSKMRVQRIPVTLTEK